MRPRYHLFLYFLNTSSIIKKYEKDSSIINKNIKVDNSENRYYIPFTQRSGDVG